MYACKMILHSRGPSGCEIATMEVTYPLAVHWDFLRHQLFSMFEQSHSVASNRSIPTNTYLRRIIDDPAEPLRWGRNQPGMVARSEMTGWRLAVGKRVHTSVRWVAILGAWIMAKLGFHKEVANWHVMPSAWVTQIVTATDWTNFFALRCHPDARAEMEQIAKMMRLCLATSKPQLLKVGEWHLPYATEFRPDTSDPNTAWRVSAGRCARVSVLRQGDVRAIELEVEKAEALKRNGHMSPFDHPAQALATDERVANLRGFKSARKFIPNEHDFALLVAQAER